MSVVCSTHSKRHDQVDHALLVVALSAAEAEPLVHHAALPQAFRDGDVSPRYPVVHGERSLDDTSTRTRLTQTICHMVITHIHTDKKEEKPPPHLVKDLQVEGVHPRRHGALDHLVPPWVLGSVVSCWRLVDGVAQSDPAVWIHPRHAVVFSQLGLYGDTIMAASVS